MSKYKKGDKFIVEIDDIKKYGDGTVYGVKGGGAFFQSTFDRLEMLKSEETEMQKKESYESGLKDAFYAAKMIEFDFNEGGISSNNLIKIFGYSSLKRIIFNFEPKKIVEKIKEYEKEKEEKEKFYVGDVVKSLKDDNTIIVTSANNVYFNGMMVDETENGKSFSPCSAKLLGDYKKTGQHFDLEKMFDLDTGE